MILRRQFEKGWSKYFREKSTNAIRMELIEAMKDWMMAEVEEESSLIKIKPLLGVLTGIFPADFRRRGKRMTNDKMGDEPGRSIKLLVL